MYTVRTAVPGGFFTTKAQQPNGGRRLYDLLDELHALVDQIEDAVMAEIEAGADEDDVLDQLEAVRQQLASLVQPTTGGGRASLSDTDAPVRTKAVDGSLDAALDRIFDKMKRGW